MDQELHEDFCGSTSLIFSFVQVKNPEKYGWEPKWLLSHIIDIYLHLDGELLAQAVANDERSFKIQTFQASSL